MAAKMPIDDAGYPIPVMSFKPGTASKKTLAASAGRFGPFSQGTQVVVITADAAVNFELGDDSVTADANDHYLPSLVPFDIALKGRTHISVFGTANVYCSERE